MESGDFRRPGVVAKTVKFLKTEVVVDIFWTGPKPGQVHSGGSPLPPPHFWKTYEREREEEENKFSNLD